VAEFSRILVWLRRDLRLVDHRALFEASRAGGEWAASFVFDRRILSQLPEDDRRLTFIHAALEEVDAGLAASGSRLLTVHGDPLEEIPALAKSLGCQAVFAAHDDDPYALERDGRAAELLAAEGIAFRTFLDHTIFERRDVLGQSGEPSKVYSPYMRAWKARFRPEMAEALDPDLSRAMPAGILPEGAAGVRSLESMGFARQSLWLEPGATGAQRRLEKFRGGLMDHYAADRDRLDTDGTSGLSVHLRHGTISVRACFRAALDQAGKGPEKWLNELIWREFYHMILACFPHVVDRPFRPEYEGLAWPGEPAHFLAWKKGETGYPIVDAAMRCFNATGWMHNRLRMVTASFLTKDLLIDWRDGEDYFALGLLDFELASNNGGWQWAASTGVDPQPYFRIFNPWLQGVKFDPEAKFIKEWVPELREIDPQAIHRLDSHPLEAAGAGYPLPIVDHAVQRVRAVELLTVKRER
jgi:deoxyribodipyrimidine photo-lyase